MQASVVIPVWNGAASIVECLSALVENSDERLAEIICVDNASTDGSAALIAAEFPQVRLLTQPVNLGFAGGVNAGVAATQAEMVVLLNQDCLVQPGWLAGFERVFQAEPRCGAVGCVVRAADGSVNHGGAHISRPLAYGVHATEVDQEEPYPVEYATGAFFACRRSVWRQLGGMDDQFYPAYYEESDFCYRLRRQGYRVLVAPGVSVIHLFTRRDWQKNPVLHHAQQHRSRYRFVCKQFTDDELLEFFTAEQIASNSEPFFHQSIGRLLASRDVLRHLAGIAAARREQFDLAGGATFLRVAEVTFGQIYRDALQRTHLLAAPAEAARPRSFEEWQLASANLHDDLASLADQPDEQLFRAQQLETLDRARHLYQQIVAPNGTDVPLLLRVPQTIQRLQVRLDRLIALQQKHIAAHDLGLSRLDLFETNANQRLALLHHRLNLIENQLTLLEYRRRVSDLLAEYEQF